MCIDEGRVTSKSKRNQFKIRKPDKPIRMGWTINKLAEVGEKGGSFASNHLARVGKATYTDVFKGKTYNIVKLIFTDVIGQGKLVANGQWFSQAMPSKRWKRRLEHVHYCNPSWKYSSPSCQTFYV